MILFDFFSFNRGYSFSADNICKFALNPYLF